MPQVRHLAPVEELHSIDVGAVQPMAAAVLEDSRLMSEQGRDRRDSHSGLGTQGWVLLVRAVIILMVRCRHVRQVLYQ